jgi:Tol biopolymer transport system component
LPQTGFPFWSLDGESLLIFDYSRGNNSTDVFLADAQGPNPRLIRSFDAWIGQVKWLSQDEILYLNGNDNEWYIWNVVTDGITPYTVEIPQENSPERFYNSDSISPNHEMLAGFYDIAAYRAAGDTRFVELTDEDLATHEAERPQVSGFDLFFLNENTKRHVDVNGQFLQSLVWSPSGRQIVVTTDYKGSDFGIYLYDVETDTIRRLTDAYNDLWYARYIPTWSPDEQWLAFKTSTGYVIQNLSTNERIQLDERINGSQLLWSPVMDYSNNVCN